MYIANFAVVKCVETAKSDAVYVIWAHVQHTSALDSESLD